MKSSERVWFSAKELEGLNGLPAHATNITRKAKNENWISREAKGIKGGGFEYHISSLPEETQASLALRDGIQAIKRDLQDSVEKHAIKETGIVNFNHVNNDYYEPISDFRGVRISAGLGLENEEQYDSAYIMVESLWFQKTGNKSKHCAMFTVRGESMEPTLKDGEEIIVDRSKRELMEGKIFVLNHNGTMLVKKVQFTYDGVELISDNPAYRPLKLNTEEANNLMIIGQVVRGYRDY
ncbi:hypothetical protein NMV45_11225 [Pasteurella multocida]|uniref:helix-turn-helix domain-containing protein n=1 Tax=Pasteurella multocida TaxID=747 RepID=UPI002A5586C0|nr:S24 family peptidase [Pasteurella multocida]MDY0489460.1 hypothetical protein [Pasteurella multocida]MDY0595990.1 hypothetical protein [Pasteurella multocida]MDY0665413.1 hypothetical protein [Pasteurella multocida]MDY0667519.1 hypothetical protein [Pasteurella multocida]